jgi:hypothetical protein
MKKKLWIVMVVILSAAMISCGGKYDTAESTLNDYADAMEDFVEHMDRTDSADAVVAAMNRFTEKMQSLAPRLQEMNQKLPELASGKTFPKELKKVSQRMDDLGQKVQTAMMKTVKFMMDPKVQQAMAAQAQSMAQVAQ